LKEEDFKLLDILHHFTSGIKAIATDVAYKGMDELRQACGGAGFSNASGMVEVW
jgi:alkylation response protein AidB-like acyl-CoA dehydrogenase